MAKGADQARRAAVSAKNGRAGTKRQKGKADTDSSSDSDAEKQPILALLF